MIAATLTAASAHATTPPESHSRTQITLEVLPESSVADLLRVEKDGYTGLHIPLAPQLTHRKLWQTHPSEMKSYPALYQTAGGTLTTGSMLRFFKRSHELFKQNSLEQKAYKAALLACINAHKGWFKNKTQENVNKLHESSEKVLKLLDTLKLSNPLVRHHLADIFSTPETGTIGKTFDWLLLGKRSTAEAHFGRNGETLHAVVVPDQKSKPLSLLLYSAKCVLCWITSVSVITAVLQQCKYKDNDDASTAQTPATLIAAAYSLIDNDDASTAQTPATLIAAAYSLIAFNQWRTDHNLTAEPGEGIDVKIEFYEGPSLDNSGNGDF